MEKTIKVGAVSYLNTKPLLHGFKHGGIIDNMELVEDYPSRIAAMLLNNEIDVGLVPVAIIPKLEEYYIVSEYCIGTEGEVASVCLFSEVPVEKVERVLLDYQSRSSGALLKILLKEYWKVSPTLEEGQADFREHIKGTTAGLVIGDRAFEQRKQSPFLYDLGEAWVKYTGLPFVFAAWIANKKLPDDFIRQFNEANKMGVENIDAVIAENYSRLYTLDTYFKKNISYYLDENKKRGLKLFLDKIR